MIQLYPISIEDSSITWQSGGAVKLAMSLRYGKLDNVEKPSLRIRNWEHLGWEKWSYGFEIFDMSRSVRHQPNTTLSFIEFKEQLKKWLLETVGDKNENWRLDNFNGRVVVHFNRKVDAVAFKLRWHE